MKKHFISPCAFFIFTIFYLEFLFKLSIQNYFSLSNATFTILFSLPFAFLFSLLSTSFGKIADSIIFYFLIFVLTLYFQVQFIYSKLFEVPFSISMIGYANQAADFVDIIKVAISNNLLIFLLNFIPLILSAGLFIFIRFERTNWQRTVIYASLFVFLYGMTFVSLLPGKNNAKSNFRLYFNVDDASAIISKFGVLTYSKIDVKRLIFNYETEFVSLAEFQTKNPDLYNIMDLHFDEESQDSSVQKLNEFIKTKEATKKNDYTGYFAGKNLIFILAEAYNQIAIDEKLTPTLYKLSKSGFVFNNFYSPAFMSTIGGEFLSMTSLIPTQEILRMWKTQNPNIYFALGNSFSRLGYKTQSYHDWLYQYYDRDRTMKTMGFPNYLAKGNGLEKRMDCEWLPSDLDLVNVTVDDYTGKGEKFCTYYITVSGHAPHNGSSRIARKNLHLLDEYDYSEPVKYYMAAQIELDKMLESLIAHLESTGELDNTVIAMVGDHYPYTLTIDEINELSTYKRDGLFEINHSNFFLWNNQMTEPIYVDKLGGQIDVLPTLLNLFGIEYDSRLLVGKDLLSDTSGIVFFHNRSWITQYGTYDSNSEKFTLSTDMALDDEANYVENINAQVSDYYTISKLILQTDYYTKLFTH